MKKYTIIVLCLFVSGCCSKEFYDKELQKDIGLSEVMLIQKYGTPTKFYDTYYGRLIEYEEKKFHCNSYACATSLCSTNFLLQNGVVVNALSKGRCCK